MTARGEHVVVGDDYRRRLQVATAIFAQIAHIIVFHFAKVDAQHGQVVLTDGSQQLVDASRLHHPIVFFLAVDGGAAGVGEVARQFSVTVGGQSFEHAAYTAELLGNVSFLLQIGPMVDLALVFFCVGEVVSLLVVAHLLVDLCLPEGTEVNACDAVGDVVDLCIRDVLQSVQQVSAGLCQ